MTSSSGDWIVVDEGALQETPCQNCGRLVTIPAFFVGCVFCADCSLSNGAYTADSEHFKVRIT